MFDLLIASHLAFAVPQLPPASPVFAETTIARSYGGSRPRMSSSSRLSRSSPSYSPSRSSSGNIVINRQRSSSSSSLGFTPKPVKTSTGATMITKQKSAPIITAPQTTKSTSVITSASTIKSAPVVTSTTKPRNTISPSPRVRTQTTYVPSPVYVDRGPDMLTNFLIWDALTGRRNNPAPVVVTQPSGDSDTKTVTITKTVDRYNPAREFAVFALGSGVTVLALKKFAKL